MKHIKTYKIFESIDRRSWGAAADGIESDITEVCDTLVDVFDKYNIFEYKIYTGNIPAQYTRDPNNFPPEQVTYWNYDLNFDWSTGPAHRYVTDKTPKKYYKYAIEINNIDLDRMDNILRDIKSLKPIIRARTGRVIKISHDCGGWGKIRIDLSSNNRNIRKYNSFINTMNDPHNQNPDNHMTGI